MSGETSADEGRVTKDKMPQLEGCRTKGNAIKNILGIGRKLTQFPCQSKHRIRSSTQNAEQDGATMIEVARVPR
jgi:hypothetical protein